MARSIAGVSLPSASARASKAKAVFKTVLSKPLISPNPPSAFCNAIKSLTSDELSLPFSIETMICLEKILPH